MNYQVSVVVPVYNVERYLAKCLDSLVNQTLESIEIIVVNDGTKDNSQFIIDQYVRNHPTKVFGFIKENGGLGDARNFGLQYAHADYVGFVDSDDYVELTMYEKLYDVATKNQSDLVLCDIEYDWENNGKKEILSGFKTLADVGQRKSVFLSPLFAWNKLYRRTLFTQYNLTYPKRLWYEDIPVTIPMFAHAKRIDYVPEVLVHYIQRETSIMGTRNHSKLEDIFSILEMTRAYFEEHGLMIDYVKELEFLYIEQLMLYGSFRFFRSDRSNELMKKAFVTMQSAFPQWRVNPYIKTLPWRYRFYLMTVCPISIPLYRLVVLNKGNARKLRK